MEKFQLETNFNSRTHARTILSNMGNSSTVVVTTVVPTALSAKFRQKILMLKTQSVTTSLDRWFSQRFD